MLAVVAEQKRYLNAARADLAYIKNHQSELIAEGFTAEELQVTERDLEKTIRRYEGLLAE